MKKHTCIKLIILLFSFIQFGCNDPKKDRLPNQFLFYHRDVIGINDYDTYSDVVAITNYENNTLTAKQLFQIARKYVDTVKANRPVSEVVFMGKNISGPQLHWDSEIWGKQKKYCIISFGFSNDFEKNIGKPIKLICVFIWKNANFISYFINKQDKQIDSVLNSPVQLDNQYNE